MKQLGRMGYGDVLTAPRAQPLVFADTLLISKNQDVILSWTWVTSTLELTAVPSAFGKRGNIRGNVRKSNPFHFFSDNRSYRGVQCTVLSGIAASISICNV